MDLQNMLIKSLNAFDGQRDRSLQVEIGPSSLGGCRRRVWHELQRSPKINETEKLAAILGTFIHNGVEKAIKREDPFGDNFMIEVEVEHDGIKGHADLFIKDLGLVVDWKTDTKKNDRYRGGLQHKYQIHTYGWLLEKNGYKVNEVALVYIPRDGSMADIKVHREPYDPEMAKAGLAWLQEIKDIIANDGPAPAPEKYAAFCSKYCPFFDQTGVEGCQSMTK